MKLKSASSRTLDLEVASLRKPDLEDVSVRKLDLEDVKLKDTGPRSTNITFCYRG